MEFADATPAGWKGVSIACEHAIYLVRAVYAITRYLVPQATKCTEQSLLIFPRQFLDAWLQASRGTTAHQAVKNFVHLHNRFLT